MNIILKTVDPNLFLIAYDKSIMVFQVFRDNWIHIEFSRQLVGIYHSEWCELIRQFMHFQLSELNDQILWRWSTHVRFSVHSLYSWLRVWGVPSFEFKSICKAN